MQKNQMADDARLVAVVFDVCDVREFAMREWGWKWVKSNWIATHTLFEKDIRLIARGVEEIIETEGCDWENEEMLSETIEIRTNNGSQWLLVASILDRDFGSMQLDAETANLAMGNCACAMRALDVASQPKCYGEVLGG